MRGAETLKKTPGNDSGEEGDNDGDRFAGYFSGGEGSI
jgi:hypothetical protein